MGNKVYQQILKLCARKEKQFAVLVDPDSMDDLESVILESEKAKVNYFFVGGSLLTSNSLVDCVAKIKSKSAIPVILFPGSELQITNKADAILFLSLISGRNADLLIGKHVVAAPVLKAIGLETISTGYLLIDGGKPTTVSYISNTFPIPSDKENIAVATAIAGEMLGQKLIYLDAGSGATNRVSDAMIKKVKQNVSVPLIVGGGINTAEKAIMAWEAGADVVVVGNAIEGDFYLIREIANTIKTKRKIK